MVRTLLTERGQELIKVLGRMLQQQLKPVLLSLRIPSAHLPHRLLKPLRHPIDHIRPPPSPQSIKAGSPSWRVCTGDRWPPQNVFVNTRIVAADRASLELAVKKFMGSDSGKTFLESPATLAFVAYTGTELSGWCWGYHLIRPDDSSMLYLHQLEVDEAYRRTGIGRALLQSFKSAGAQAGATKMFLTTGADNTPARTLYNALGGGPPTQGPTVNYWFLLNP